MRSLRYFLPLFFIFALLFAQQGAVTHSIAHTLVEQSQDQSLPHHEHCDLCAVYAQIGGAVASGHVHFDFAVAFRDAFTQHSASFQSATFVAFAARAPPAAA
jgi:hypothetical protein